jgi:hypothetical protein
MRRLFALAALVMFIFALIAATRSGTFLSTEEGVWLSAGFVAFAADQVLGGVLAKT